MVQDHMVLGHKSGQNVKKAGKHLIKVLSKGNEICIAGKFFSSLIWTQLSHHVYTLTLVFQPRCFYVYASIFSTF